MAPWDSARAARVTAAAAAIAVAVGVLFRLYALGRLPGINGDEAWYGVQVLRLLAGDPVDWRTPSGNLPGPVHSGLLLVLQPLAPRSLAVLRLPSLLASLGQLLLGWWVVRRHLGPEAATRALVLAAVLPIQIAYARFGWDPSSTGLVAVAAAHFALGGVAWASAALFALALAVHPTNVFLGPFLWLIYLFAEASRSGWRRAALRSLLHGALLAAGLGVIAVALAGGAGQTLAAGALDRLWSPGEWGRFGILLARFLSGDTVYEYIVGTGLGAARTAADVAVGLLLAALLAVGVARLRRRPASMEVGIVVAWLTTLAAFFVLAGLHGLKPHLERYAMVLVVPTLLAVTVLLGEVGEWTRRRWIPDALVGAVAAAALVGFGACYFAPLEETGSTSHQTFWSGPVEPKGEIFRRIAEEGEARGGARVIAEDWWTFWALAYLGHGTRIEVLRPEDPQGRAPPGGTYWVGYAGGPLERWAAGSPALLPRWEVQGAGGRVVLRGWWAPPGAEPLKVRRSGGAPH